MLSRFSRILKPQKNTFLCAIPRRFLHSVEYTDLNASSVFRDRRDRKFVFMGMGSIAKSSVDMLEKFIDVNYENVILVDQYDMRSVKSLAKVLGRGVRFVQREMNNDDWEPLFKELDLQPFDVVVDLTTNTNAYKIVETLKRMSLMYLNTALEINWHNSGESLYENSLQIRHDEMTKIHAQIKDQHNASQIFEFGMNPGLISHFAFQGLLDVAGHVLRARSDPQLAEYVAQRQYNMIAKHLQLHTIHVSEIDSQKAHGLPDDGTFVNTWSVYGLLEEGLEPAQAGWGTHERKVPADGELLKPSQIAFRTPAYRKYHRSYLPNEEFIGMVIPHGEAITLNEALTAPGYSPTVHYVYRVCEQTKALMDRMSFDDLSKVKKWRVLNPFDDDLSGEDRVGALLLFPRNPITGEERPWSYWFGSILGQGTSPFFGPTHIQVTVGVLSALKYIVEHNRCGPMYPEHIPTDYILRNALPHMGHIVSSETKWNLPSTQFADLSVEDYNLPTQKH